MAFSFQPVNLSALDTAVLSVRMGILVSINYGGSDAAYSPCDVTYRSGT